MGKNMKKLLRFYQLITGTTVKEFGMITSIFQYLEHQTVFVMIRDQWNTARMLEIKCPTRREFWKRE